MKKKFTAIFIVALAIIVGTIVLIKSNSNDSKQVLEYYRIITIDGDTTIWRASNCKMNGKEFECDTKDCPDGKFNGVILNRKHRPIDTITYDDTVITNLNFGWWRKTDYIPKPKYPEFNHSYYKKLFATVKKKACSIAETFGTPYELTAIGLPDSVILYKVNNKDKYSNHMYPIWKPYIPTSTLYTLSDWVPNKSTSKKTKEFKIKKVPLQYRLTSCKNLDLTVHVKSFPHYTCICQSGGPCRSQHLPAPPESHKYKLVITAIDLPDTTINWKIVYKDRYGNSDTVNITTEFK